MNPMFSILLTQANEDGDLIVKVETGRDSDAIAMHALVEQMRQHLPPNSRLTISLVRHPHTASNGEVKAGALLKQYQWAKRWDAKEKVWLPKRMPKQTPIMELPVSTRQVETT